MAQKSPRLAKITRPSARRLLARPRLFRLLDRYARDARAIWINAPGGSGKTSLISSWIEARKWGSLWYSLDAGDADPATFFHYLGEAAKAAPRRRKQPLPHLTPEYLPALDVFVRRFFENLFSRYTAPFVLVLDNYQETPADAQLHAMMSVALAAVPEGCHIVFLSRGEAPPAFARWQADRQFASLPTPEIWLTDTEARALARATARAVPKNVAALNDLARGWIAGLILLLRARREGVAAPESPTGNAQAVFDYFATEVFARLPDDTRELLLKTAWLPHVTPALAVAITGRPDAEALLADVFRNRLFMDRRSGSDAVYEYHPLFREFLQTQATQRYDAGQLTEIARAAGRSLEDTGNTEAALNQYAQVKDWDNAIRVILAEAPRLMAQGRWPALQQWIGEVPAALRDAEPWLRYWQGCCLLMSNPPAGRKELEVAYAGFEAANNPVGQVLASSTLIECYAIQFVEVGQADPWIDALNRLVTNGVNLPPDMEVRARVNLLVGLLSRRPNDPQLQNLDVWIEQFLAAELDANVKMQLFIWLFPYAYWHSRASQQRRLTEVIERLSTSGQATPLSQLFGVLCLAMAKFEVDDFQVIVRYYHHGRKIIEECGLTFCAPLLHAHYLQAAITHGQIVYARKAYQEHYSVLAASTESTIVAHFDIITARLAAAEGNQGGALVAARDFKARVIDSGALPGPMHAGAAVHIALALQEVGATAEARDTVRQARQAVSSLASKFPVLDAQLHFIEAVCDMDDGSDQQGLMHLRSGLEIAVAYDYQDLCVFVWSRSLGARCCTEALLHGIETNFARKFIRTFRIGPPAPHMEDWPWRLTIFTLGKFHISQDDEPVQSSGKSQQRVLDLLKALIAFGVRDVNIDRLSAALWPDAEGDAAKRAFDVTLHRLRKLLGVEQAIVVADAKVSINTDLCWVDTLALEQVLEDANADSARAVEQVLKLYRGHFLQDQKEQPWLFEPRERLAGKVFRCLDMHGARLEQAGDVEGAIALYQRVVDLNPLAEAFYRKLMSCFIRVDRQADALAIYRRCHQMLSRTMGVNPSPETEKLRAELSRST